VKAVPINFTGEAFPLISSGHSLKDTFPQRVTLLKYRIAERLSQKTKKRIRKVFSLLGINL
jgi:hypothetical protein